MSVKRTKLSGISRYAKTNGSNQAAIDNASSYVLLVLPVAWITRAQRGRPFKDRCTRPRSCQGGDRRPPFPIEGSARQRAPADGFRVFELERVKEGVRLPFPS